MLSEYSEAEQKLVRELSTHWADVIKTSAMSPPNVYKIMAYEMFVANKQGPAVDALRDVCNRLDTLVPVRRLTKEFDDLCRF